MRNVIKGTIEDKWIDIKLKDFLKEELKLSSRIIKKLAIERQIFINKKSVKLDYKIRKNDSYMINLDRDESQNIEPVKMELDIIYEDESILIVNKPPFMVVHPTKSHQDDTLTNGILYYFKQKGEKSIVRLVSRLDMNTSGLVIIAKNQYTHSYFSRIMSEDLIKKEYIGICTGVYENEEGTINEPILKESEDSYKRIVHKDGQNSVTHFKVVEKLNGYTVVHFRLETGRTHQIRVHTTFLNHPLVNDELYEGEILSTNPRQFLHAYHLNFPHPMTNEIMDFKIDLPNDMKEFINSNKY